MDGDEIAACLARMDTRLTHIEEAQREQRKDIQDLRAMSNKGLGALAILLAIGGLIAWGGDVVKFLAGRP